MRTNQQQFTTRVLVAAVHAALLTLALMPAARAADSAVDPAVAELTRPANRVEIGAGNVSSGSAKFGEYNGLEKKGGYAVGNFQLGGGGAYDSGDTTRWRISGTDLGLETRNVTGEYSNQGRFTINFGYDELLRNKSDTYQSPYLGLGSTNLTLPASWMNPILPRVSTTATNARGLSPTVAAGSALVNGVLTAPTASQLAQSAAIIAADVPAFQNFNVHTKRTKYDLGFAYNIDTEWDVKASYRHEHKDGTKLMSSVTQFQGELSTIMPDVIDQNTDQYNASVNFHNAKSFATVAYYGSIFKNDVTGMTWQNWAVPTFSQTISSPPDNQFHQLSLTGGYSLTPTTKLVAYASYARNTQNQALINAQELAMPLPVGSANALVVTKAFNLKLTSRPMKSLNLSAAYKYDDHDNKTPVNLYAFYDNDQAKSGASIFNAALGLPAGTLGSNANLNANRAYSKKLNQVNLDADYAVNGANALKFGYDYQGIDRWCNGSWIACVDAATTKENTGRAEWRAKLSDDLNARIGYAYSQRKVGNYNENAFLALVPMANATSTGAPAGTTAYGTMTGLGLTGYGPISGLNPAAPAGSALGFYFPLNNALSNALYGNGNRISELPGMRRYNMADRNRDKLRTSLNWQASDKLSFQGALDYNKDDYNNSVYGLQNAKGWAFNADATYSFSEDFSASVFYTYEDMNSRSAGNSYTANSAAANVNGFTAITGGCFATIALRNASNKVDPCLNWTADMTDKTDTIGLTAKRKNLMGGKLELTGDLMWSRANSDNNPAGGNYANNPLAVAGAPAGTVAAFFIAAQSLPTVTTDTTRLRLTGRYQVDKAQAWRVGYTYAHLKSTDYSYDGLQYGSLTGVLPTNEKAPNYSVNVIAVSYQYTFR